MFPKVVSVVEATILFGSPQWRRKMCFFKERLFLVRTISILFNHKIQVFAAVTSAAMPLNSLEAKNMLTITSI